MPTFLSVLALAPQWRIWRIRAAISLYVAIVIVGSIPGARAEIGTVASGIVLHALAYATLAFLLFTGTMGSARARAIKAVLGVMLMGACDEFVQSFLPYRHGDIHDWLVDVSAALVACSVLWFVLPASLPEERR